MRIEWPRRQAEGCLAYSTQKPYPNKNKYRLIIMYARFFLVWMPKIGIIGFALVAFGIVAFGPVANVAKRLGIGILIVGAILGVGMMLWLTLVKNRITCPLCNGPAQFIFSHNSAKAPKLDCGNCGLVKCSNALFGIQLIAEPRAADDEYDDDNDKEEDGLGEL